MSLREKKMGRKKIEVKRIEDRCNRHVTFCKRRSGLFKKAQEISILCDLEVGLILFNDRGKLFEFSSGNSLLNIFDRYKSEIEGRNQSLIGTDNDNKDHQSNQETLESLGNLLKTVQSLVEELNVEKLEVTDLMQLESKLEITLNQIKYQRIGAMMETDD